MRLWAFGGDARMQGVLQAAREAGYDAVHIRSAEDAQEGKPDIAMLPWPRSFDGGKLIGATGEGMDEARVGEMIKGCGLLVHGRNTPGSVIENAKTAFDPEGDETFLRANAELTAEGAICSALHKMRRAMVSSTCMITGFGRIGQGLARRLWAMGAFVIVCARSEKQMHLAHSMGAHPVPLAQIGIAAAQADVIFNTVPARIIGKDVLSAVKKDALIVELASRPYGVDVDEAVKMGLHVSLEGGVPGRYAPSDAGRALFDAAQRKWTELNRETAKGADDHG